MKPLFLSVLMLAGTTMFAQQQPPTPNENGRQMETLTGCLTKSATEGEYVLSDKNGEKYTFRGPQRLDSYVNHTVQMSGTMMSQNGEKRFQPQSVKTVSDTCQGQ